MSRYNSSGNKSEKNNNYKSDNRNRTDDRKKSYKPSYKTNDKPYGDRKKSYNSDERPFGSRDNNYRSEERPYSDRKKSYNSDERPYANRNKSYNSDEKPFGERKKSYRPDSKPFERRKSYKSDDMGFVDRNKSYNSEERPFGSRDNNYKSEERPYGDRRRSYNSDEKPFGERKKSYRPDSKPFERRKSYKSDDVGFADRNKSYNSEDRPFSRRDNSYKSEERSYGDRNGDRRKNYNSDDKPFGERKNNYRSEGRPFGERKKSYRSENGLAERSFRRPNNQSKRDAKSYNPLMFIKDVEEQTTAPAYTPKHKFDDFQIDAQIKQNIINKGYEAPTPIQDQVIPLILEGKDVVGTANTGTGKTAAFLIPLVHNILEKKTNKVLVIAPTRELAAQIKEELNSFKAKTQINSALCIGGVSVNLQIQYLKSNPEFIIGTPGRLKDLEKTRNLDFSKFTSIVLDEVDTMLDMGFINDIKYIVSKLPQKRHSLFFSATISKDIKEVMNKFLFDPVTVSVKTRQSAENVNQTTVKVDAGKKIDQLHDLLIQPAFSKVIVFSRTKRAVDKLSRSLKERGFDIAAIHGDKTQAQRKKSLAAFKDDKIKVLLATDVVARGIDIDDVSHVINFDMPQTYEDYIHRIGRTGRANKVGQAITFIE